MSRWRWTAFALCLLLIFAYEGYAIFLQEVQETAHLPPDRDISLTPEINETNVLYQSFVVHTDGLRAVDVFPRASVQPAAGPMDVTVALAIDTNVWYRLAHFTVDVATLDLAGVAHLAFPRIEKSAGLLFRVEIRLPNAPRGQGLRFQAGGPTYVQGVMDVGEQRQWGDLKFRATAERPTVYDHIRRIRSSLPAPLQTDLFWISALIALNWALATVLYYLGFAGEGLRQRPNGSAYSTADQPRV